MEVKRLYLKLDNLEGVSIRLSEDKIKATEQIMNAIYLNMRPKFSMMIEEIISLKNTYLNFQASELPILMHSYSAVLNKCNLEYYDNFNDSILLNSNFNVDLTFNSPEHKQLFIDEWFSVNTGRINFNGIAIKFSDKFIDEITETAAVQHKKSKYNSEDQLIYNLIMPVVTELNANAHDETRQILNKFVNTLEKK